MTQNGIYVGLFHLIGDDHESTSTLVGVSEEAVEAEAWRILSGEDQPEEYREDWLGDEIKTIWDACEASICYFRIDRLPIVGAHNTDLAGRAHGLSVWEEADPETQTPDLFAACVAQAAEDLQTLIGLAP